MEKISINSIVVLDRYRTDIGDIIALADSINELGLLQPVGITSDRHLVFGERRLRACKSLGWTEIQAKVVDCDALLAEQDENVLRKDFTTSERVAIARAIEERLKQRIGINQHTKSGSGNISLPSDQGQTRDLAAKKTGFGSGKTLEAAKRVVEHGTPALIMAMDEGKASIHGAASISKMPTEEQNAIDFSDASQVKKARDRAYARDVRERNSNAEPVQNAKAKPEISPDINRIFEEGSGLSAFVLAIRAKDAIQQIIAKDPNAIRALDSIQEALAEKRNMIEAKQ